MRRRTNMRGLRATPYDDPIAPGPFEFLPENAPGMFEQSVINLQAKAREFATVYEQFFAAQPPQDDASYGEWSNINTVALATRATIESVGGAIASVTGWARNTFGLSAVRGVGFLPAIPGLGLAAILAAIAGVVYVLDLMRGYLQSRGLYAPGGVLADTLSLVKWGILGFVIWQALPLLTIKRRES